MLKPNPTYGPRDTSDNITLSFFDAPKFNALVTLHVIPQIWRKNFLHWGTIIMNTKKCNKNLPIFYKGSNVFNTDWPSIQKLYNYGILFARFDLNIYALNYTVSRK